MRVVARKRIAPHVVKVTAALEKKRLKVTKRNSREWRFTVDLRGLRCGLVLGVRVHAKLDTRKQTLKRIQLVRTGYPSQANGSLNRVQIIIL